jgi:hypothetical protein
MRAIGTHVAVEAISSSLVLQCIHPTAKTTLLLAAVLFASARSALSLWEQQLAEAEETASAAPVAWVTLREQRQRSLQLCRSLLRRLMLRQSIRPMNL